MDEKELQKLMKSLNTEEIKAEHNKIEELLKSKEYVEATPDEKIEKINHLKNYFHLKYTSAERSGTESNTSDYVNLSPFILDLFKLTPKAFNNCSTLDLISKLSSIDRVNHFNDVYSSLDPNLNNYYKKLDIIRQIESGIKQIEKTHYSLISVLIQLHLFITMVVENEEMHIEPEKKIKLFHFMKLIELYILTYNSHHVSDFKTEEIILYKLQTIKSILFKLKSLLLKKKWGVTQTNEKKSDNITEKNKKKSNTEGQINRIFVKKNYDLEIEAINDISDFLNITNNKTVFIVGTDKTPAPTPPSKSPESSIKNQKTKSLKKKDIDKKSSDSMSSVTDDERNSPNNQQSVLLDFTPLNFEPINLDFEINLSDLTDLDKTFTHFKTFFQNLINYELRCIGILKNYALAYNFDIYTLKFELFIHQDENQAKIQAIQSDLALYFNKQIMEMKLAPPLFIIESKMRVSSFLGKSIIGKNLRTLSLFPGEERELRFKTNLTTKNEREQAKTILESKSKTAKENFKKSLNNEISKNQALSNEFNQYIDAKRDSERSSDAMTAKARSSHKEVALNSHLDFSAQAAVNLGSFGIPAEVSISTDTGIARQSMESGDLSDTNTQQQHSGTSSGLSKGTSNQINANRELASKVMESAISDHSQEIVSKRDITINEVSKESEEMTKEEGTVSKITNRNKNSVLYINFHELSQEYIIFYHLVDINIIFTNGIDWVKYPLRSLPSFLDKYILPEYPEYKKILVDLVKVACRPVDYKNRVISLLDEKNQNFPLLKRNSYYDFLVSNYKKNELDSDEQEYLGLMKGIKGILISKFTQIIKQNGFKPVPHLSNKDCLDLFAKKELQINLDVMQEEQNKMKLANRITQSNIDFCDNIKDVDKAAQDRFKLLVRTQDIFNKTYLMDFLNKHYPNEMGMNLD